MWETAKRDFQFLQSEGHENVIVIGQSLGGVMALRLATNSACQALIVMSAPLMERPINSLENRIRSFTKRYYYSHQQSEESLEDFIRQHFPRPITKLRALQQFLLNTQEVLPSISKPICLVKGALDADVYKDSIDLIEEIVKSPFKKKLTYSNSGHLVTIDKDREHLYEDIQLFIEKVNNDD